MLQSVEANLIADLIWLPLGGFLLWLAHSVLREIREERREAAAHRVAVTEQRRDATAALSDQIAAVHNRLDAMTPAPSQEVSHADR